MKVLVFSAHPDDAEFVMGGTLLQMCKQYDVTLAVMTDGSAGTYGNARIRKQEQEEAAKKLGAKLIWVGNKDCSLQHDQAHTLQVAQIIRDVQPEAIFSTHWDLQGDVMDYKAHPEHRILGRLVRDATRYARFGVEKLTGEKHTTPYVYWYMVPEHIMPKIAVRVDAQDPQLQDVWNAHKSQHKVANGKVLEMLKMNREQRARWYPNAKYVEFFDTDKPMLMQRHDILEALREDL